MKSNNNDFTGGRIEGPAAPKDPEERRGGFFVMFETAIEATARAEGSPSQEVYLEGNYLTDKARYIGGITDEGMLALLTTWAGFRELVHSIGVSVKTGTGSEGEKSPFLCRTGAEAASMRQERICVSPVPWTGRRYC